MFAANRSIVPSVKETFEPSDSKIIFFRGCIYVTESPEVATFEKIRDYKFKKIIILSPKYSTIQSSLVSNIIKTGCNDNINNFNINTITVVSNKRHTGYPSSNPDCETRYCSIEYDTLTEEECISVADEMYHYVYQTYPYDANTLIICNSFQVILPILFNYCLFVDGYGCKNSFTKLTAFSALRSFCKPNDLCQFSTYIDKLNTTRT